LLVRLDGGHNAKKCNLPIGVFVEHFDFFARGAHRLDNCPVRSQSNGQWRWRWFWRKSEKVIYAADVLQSDGGVSVFLRRREHIWMF
jgi:hypothetical protein